MKFKMKSRVIAMLLLLTMLLGIFPSGIALAKISTPSGMSISSQTDYTLATGVTETHATLSNGGSPLAAFITTISPTAKVELKASYSGYYTKNSTPESRAENAKNLPLAIQKTTEQAKAYEAATGEKVIYATNGDFFDGAMACRGPLVIEGNVLQVGNYSRNEPFFAVLKDGSYAIRDFSADMHDVQEAIGAFHMLVKDGKNVAVNLEVPSDDIMIAVKHPRSALGIKADGSLVSVVVDGRRDGYSVGVDLYDLADIMIAAGCVDAVNIDGGGSSTYATARDGGSLTIRNKVTDDTGERTVASALLLVASDCNHTYTKKNYTINTDGTHSMLCDSCKEPVKATHYFVNGVCECGKTEEKATSLFFDFSDTDADKERYANSAYSHLNFDAKRFEGWSRGYWATKGVSTSEHIVDAFDIDNSAGTMTIPVAAGQPLNISNYGPYVKTTAVPHRYPAVAEEDTLPLNFDPSTTEVIEVRFKVTGCESVRAEGPRVVAIFDQTTAGTTAQAEKTPSATYQLQDGVYQTVTISVPQAIRDCDSIRSLAFRFMDLQSVNDGKVVIDSIYMGPKTASTEYTVTFQNYGGAVLETKTVKHGEDVTYTGATPTREPGKQNHFKFKGWNKELTNITADTVITATYEIIPHNAKTCTVTTVPTTAAKGSFTGTCTACGADFTIELPKLSDTEYTKTVVKAATCTANGTNKYTWNTTTYGTVSFTETVEKLGHDYDIVINTAPTFTQKGSRTLTCKNDASHTYTEEMDVLHKALYFDFTNNADAKARYNNYVYNFTNFDEEGALRARTQGNVNGTNTVNTTAGTLTLKPATSATDYTSIFADSYKYDLNFDPEFAEYFQMRFKMKGISGTEGKANIDFFYGEGSSDYLAASSVTFDASYLNSGEYITVTGPIRDAIRQKDKITRVRITIKGFTAPTDNTNVEVTFDYAYAGPEATLPTPLQAEQPEYTVTFKNYGGEVLETKTVKEGEDAVYTGATPTREPGIKNHFEFKGWNKELTNITADTVITATYEIIPHSAKTCTVTTKPTADAKGSFTGTCTECGADFTIELPKLSDTEYTKTVVKAANCTEDGTDKYTWNTTDHGTVSFTETTKKLGHSYKAVVTPPTYTDQGYTTHTCSVCGDSYQDTFVAPLAHSYTYTVSKEPTLKATGTLTGNCSECTEIITVTLPKLNTTDYTKKVVKAANCTEDGTDKYTWKTTAYGNFSFTVTNAKLGHKYETTVTAPTWNTAGGQKTACACGDVTANEAIVVAKIGNTSYTVLADAFAAAANGSVISIQYNVTEPCELMFIENGVTIDLNGHTLAADYVVGLSGSAVIDSSADNTGKLLIPNKDKVALDAVNSGYMPVYDDNGYIFTNINMLETFNATNPSLYQFLPKFESFTHNALAEGFENSGVKVVLRVVWDGDTYKATQNFVYTDDFVKQVVESYDTTTPDNYALAFNAELKRNDSGVANYTVSAVVISGTGVEVTSKGLSFIA